MCQKNIQISKRTNTTTVPVIVEREIWRVSRCLNSAKQTGRPVPGSLAARGKAEDKLAWLADIATWLVSMGLLGTVIGFYLALPAETISPDIRGAQQAISGLMVGMKTAIGTTILGVILALWHEVNLRILSTGMAVYWGDRLLAGERHR